MATNTNTNPARLTADLFEVDVDTLHRMARRGFLTVRAEMPGSTEISVAGRDRLKAAGMIEPGIAAGTWKLAPLGLMTIDALAWQA